MLKIHHLQKVINQNTVVDIDELEFGPGEIAAIVGPVGSGRDELFELLIGRMQPTAGEIILNGTDISADKTLLSRQQGVLFAEDTLYLNQTPHGFLTFNARLFGLPKSRVDEVLALVGLMDHMNVKINKLPSSLKRRLSFGRVILHEPQILILVEPFAKCDESSIVLLRGLIRRQAYNARTILLFGRETIHYSSLSDTVYKLDRGRIIEVIRSDETGETPLPFKIPVRLEGSVVLVNPADIYYASTEDGRTHLHTIDGHFPAQFTMADLESRLSRSGFFRAHRGYLVNLQHVKEVITFTRSSFNLKLDDPEASLIPLSKDAARELRDLLGY